MKLDRRIDFEPRTLADADNAYDTLALHELLLKVGRAKWNAAEFDGCVEHLRTALLKHFEYVQLLESSETSRQTSEVPDAKSPANGANNASPIGEERAPFRHVVVADHSRGVISRSLIEELVETRLVSNLTRWYILTKSASPRWLADLKNQSSAGKVALLYYHPAASDHLSLKGPSAETDSIESWLISCGERSSQSRDRARLTQDAFLALADHHGINWTDDALVVTTPKGLQAAGLARHQNDWKWEVGSADREAEPSHEPQVGRSSAFFARLASWAMLCEGRYDPWEAIQDARKEARSYVQNMVAHFRDRLEDREEGSEDALPIGVDTQPPNAQSARGEWQLLSFPPTRPADDRLELWRAMQDVPDYVAIDPKKRANIRRLQRGLREFMERPERSRQTYAAMITAPPGSGKTTLVKKLAEMNQLVLQECNLTQIFDRPQLLLFLDRLAHVQSGTDHPLLVFVDEINTPVAGHPAYDVFLSVLSGGTFGTAGDVRRLRPAASELLATKEPDFHGRMNAPDISLAVDGEALRTEMFFVWMTKLYDRGVRRVTPGLLQHVWDQIRRRTSLRDIDKLIDRLRNLPADRPLSVRDIDPSETDSKDVKPIRLEREPEIRFGAMPR